MDFKLTFDIILCIPLHKNADTTSMDKNTSDTDLFSLLEIFIKILTKTLPRSMQDSNIRIVEKSGLKMGQDLSQIYVWSTQDLDMVESRYTQDPYNLRHDVGMVDP